MPGPVNHHDIYHLAADETFRLIYQLAVRAIAAENGGRVEQQQVRQYFAKIEAAEQLPPYTFFPIALDIEKEMQARRARNLNECIAAELR